MDLLIVTTQPNASNYNQQGGLWVFNACPGLQTPRLMFGMSTGQGGTGYVPTVGCRDGVIAVGRISGSIQLVDIATGIAKWNGDISAVIQPQGNNTQAVFQSFYMADPDYWWKDGDTSSGSQGANWGVAMTPCQVTVDNKPALQVAVGFSQPGAQYQGTALTGLPVFRLPYEPGKYKALDPFIADSVSQEMSKTQNAAPAHAFARPSMPIGGHAATRVASWPRATVMQNGQAVTRDVALGVSAYQPELRDVQGLPIGKLGNSLILEDVTEELGKHLGCWPAQAPFGNGVGYEILRKVPVVDELTGLIAVPVQNLKTNAVAWFVIDCKNPAAPKTVHMEPNLSSCGGFSNGILFGISGGKIVAKKVVDGIAGVDEGECYTMQAQVDMAMDGKRTGAKDLIGVPGNDNYLFWVNNDCDMTSWKRDDFPLSLDWSLVEDDEQEGTQVHVVRPTAIDWSTEAVVPNCKDGNINGKRDLEDFTRLHLRVDAQTAGFPGVTYWMKFEGDTPGDTPSVNLVQAVDPTMEYLAENSTTADKQTTLVINGQPNPYPYVIATIGASEVQLANYYVLPNGDVSPFLLEGSSKGNGRLILTAKLNGTNIGQTSIDLELKPISDFWEKYVVTAPAGDDVQQEATPIGTCTYQPESDEYVLFVHGWNMGGWDTDGWEKDRWAETVFKRLWWLGYKGRMGGFQWPTLGTFSYDQSEFRAWRSGAALAKLLTQLNSQHPGQVRMIAHSMGNVVAGEAIYEAPANVVHTYIATQAAIPAHMYDNSTRPYWDGPYNTPDVYGHYISGQDPDKPYLSSNPTKLAPGRLFNYFNTDDWALARWKQNNKGVVNDWFSKPDVNSGHFYEDRDGNIDTYNPEPIGPYSIGDWFHSYAATLTFPKDRFEIFAFCAQSRSNPLGAESALVSGFTSRNLKNLPQIPEFGKTHVGHSREFRSDLTNERGYWMWVGFDFGLQGFEDPSTPKPK